MLAILENLVGIYRLCRNPALLWQEIRRLKDDYFIYNHRLLLVVGSMFSRYLTDAAVINVLMWYLTDKGGDLVISAVLASIHYALSLMLVIITSNLAYLVVGRVRTLMLCDIASLGGLVIFWQLVEMGWSRVVVVGLVLLAVGKSGSLLLDELVFDLMDEIDNSQDRTRERSIKRQKTWSYITKMFANISATLRVAPNALGKTYPSWNAALLTCIIAITMTLLTFVIGYGSHPQERLTERSCSPLFRVLCAGIQKLPKCISWRCFVNPTRHDERSLSLDTSGKEDAKWNEDNKAEIKQLLRMVPMWVIYLVVALILATKDTFFYEQYSNLDGSNDIPIQIYDVAFSFSKFAIPCLYSWIHGFRKTDKFKIGLGLLCAIISCVIAWQLEVHRLKEAKDLNSDEDTTSISFLWLVPQFCFLGGMYGLIFGGLLDFRSQVQDEGIRNHRHKFMIFLEGIAMVIHIFFILIFEHEAEWIGVSINESRLDNYFLVLACICLASFIIYCYIATRFYKGATQSQEEDNDSHNQELSDKPDLQPEHQLLTIKDSQQDHQHLANDDAQKDHPVLAIDDSQQDHPVLAADDSQQDQLSMIGNSISNSLLM